MILKPRARGTLLCLRGRRRGPFPACSFYSRTERYFCPSSCVKVRLKRTFRLFRVFHKCLLFTKLSTTEFFLALSDFLNFFERKGSCLIVQKRYPQSVRKGADLQKQNYLFGVHLAVMGKLTSLFLFLSQMNKGLCESERFPITIFWSSETCQRSVENRP